MRVPIGFPCLVSNIAEFFINLTEDPSFFLTFIFVWIISAFTISPFKTFDLCRFMYLSCCTEAIIMSPNLAVFLLNPPRTFMHLIFLAPELSAMLSVVFCCIISSTLRPHLVGLEPTAFGTEIQHSIQIELQMLLSF